MGKMIQYEKSLAYLRPDLAKEWHPTKNLGLKNGFGNDISTPDKVVCGSSQVVWWMYRYDVPDNYPVEHLRGKHFDFEWRTRVDHRVNGIGCPFLSNPPQAVWKGFNDLLTLRPDLAKEWNYEKNRDLTNNNGDDISTPDKVTDKSAQEVWWLLPYTVPNDYPVEHLRGKLYNFEWKAIISNRAKGYGCPYLSNPSKAVWKGFNDLSTVKPELAKEWHPTKNGNLKPDDVTCGCNTKVWWYLSYDDQETGKHFDFEWKCSVNNRANKERGCPFLSGKDVWKGFNDLETKYPDIAKEWHPSKNGDLEPCDVTWCSGQRVWWQYPYDVPCDFPVKHLRGKHFDFEWKATIASRINGKNGCPYLSNEAVWAGFNDLETINPELAKEWHPTKNGNITPKDVAPNSNKTYWWSLSYDVPNDYPVEHLRGKHFDFEWLAVVQQRNIGIGCLYLSGHAVWKGFNDLETVNPKLAKEWHPTKNGDLKPYDVTANNAKSVWWLFPYDDPKTGKHFDFEWKSSIANRNSNNGGCPFLSGRLWKGFNDLATVNPELAKEWHPTKNGTLKPTDITAGVNKKAWWYLKYKDIITGKCYEFEWPASIASRNSGIGCPFLSESTGERFVRKYLDYMDIRFKYEKTFEGLNGIGNQRLSYDFHLTGTKILIEYQGIQHFKAIDYFGGEKQLVIQKEHDKRKRQYAKKNKYYLIEIHYKFDTYDKVRKYLDENLLPLFEYE